MARKTKVATAAAAAQEESVMPQPSAKAKGKAKAARHQPLAVEQPSEEDVAAAAAAAAASESASASTSKPTLQDRQAKLAELRAKMASTTKANRKEILNEQSRSRNLAAQSKPTSSRKLQKAEKLLEERDLNETGQDVERYRNMLYSLEDSERWDAKLATKEQSKDQGQLDFQDAAERSYQRQVRQLKPDLAAYKQSQDPSSTKQLVARPEAHVDTIHYGSHKPSDDAIDRLVSHLNHEQQIIKNRSRQRQEDPDADVTYINERNKHFNKKLKRFYDGKTREIRENRKYQLTR